MALGGSVRTLVILITLLMPLHGAAAVEDVGLPRASVDLPPSPRVPFIMGPIDGPPPVHLASNIRLDNVTARAHLEDSGVRVEYSMDVKFIGYDPTRFPAGRIEYFIVCPAYGFATCTAEPVFVNVTREHYHLTLTTHKPQAASPAQCVYLTYAPLEGYGGGYSNNYCLYPEHYAVDV